MLPITKLCTAFCVGVLVHVGLFKKGEWHLEAPRVLVLHALVFTAIVIMDARTTEQSSLYNSYCVVLGYLSGLFSSIVTYRLSPWHRLHDFPGPRLAAVSKFWHVWQCRDSRNHELMERLHNQYGDFVRIGMGPPQDNLSLIAAKTDTPDRFRAIRSRFVPSRVFHEVRGQ